MLYFFTSWLRTTFNLPGFGVFQYVTFRSAAATISALLISFIVAPWIILMLKRMQIGEQAKSELQETGNHSLKAGTPTMGGLIVLSAVIIPTLLWTNIQNTFVILIVFITLGLGAVGFLDDFSYNFDQYNTLTTVPFAKDIHFDFGWIYIPAIMFILTATSNAVNLTDGLDGLAIGTVGIAALALAVISYVSGNAVFSQYLNIFHLRGADELTIFSAALVGASLGFLWFNSFPAQVFMGDTGSLALGGALGGLCILIKKEFLLPILGGVFFAETLSVIIQVLYFKYSKKKYGEGKRLLKMSPLHHHFEKSGLHESKIVTRFYIIGILLAIITMATFKVR